MCLSRTFHCWLRLIFQAHILKLNGRSVVAYISLQDCRYIGRQWVSRCSNPPDSFLFAPKMQHRLLCCASFKHPALQTFDDNLKYAAEQICSLLLNGSRQICQSRWRSGIRRVRSNFLPLWLQRQACFLSLSFLLAVRIRFSLAIWFQKILSC